MKELNANDVINGTVSALAMVQDGSRPTFYSPFAGLDDCRLRVLPGTR